MDKKEICYCYEKFKKNLPKDFKPKCFKENCDNYRKNVGIIKK